MKFRFAFLPALALVLILARAASADGLILPEGLTVIGEEAFSGAVSLDEAVLPEGLERIESRAFAGSGIRRIYLPASVSFIAEDAFEGCGLVSGYGPEDTWASDFFDGHDGLVFEHLPRYFALLVGNGDYNGDGDTVDPNDLKGPHYDVGTMEPVLTGLDPAWTVTKKTDLKATQIVSAIHEAFDSTRETDICLFHYSGHGAPDGVLTGVDWHGLTAQSLADELNLAAKGKVIVLLDCCYSGAVITARGDGQDMKNLLAGFNEAVISAFSGYTVSSAAQPSSGHGVTPRAGELIQDKFYVLTACGPDQVSNEFTVASGTYSYGLMSYELIRGLGCTYPYGVYGGNFRADADQDSQLTLSEALAYITADIARKQNDVVRNHDQYYTAWQSDYQISSYYDGVRYATYDAYFEARYSVLYHAYDQVTASHGDGAFVLFAR